MKLPRTLLDTYQEQGYLFMPQLFTEAEMQRIKACIPQIVTEDSARRVLERDGVTVRSVYGSHETHEPFRHLTRDVRLLGSAMQILQSDLYVYQFKINTKAGFSGDIWQWHQDFIFWMREDGVPRPDLVTVSVFLDDVHELNGPIAIIPGSHERVIDVAGLQHNPAGYADREAWVKNLTAEINYAVPRETVAALVRERGMHVPKGPAGSVLFFHPNVVHGSASNISPADRALALITYNSFNILPTRTTGRRPDFLCSRDCRAISPEGAGM